MDKLNQIQTNDRHLQIKSIQQFVSNSKELLNGILREFNWTEDATYFKEGETRLKICPQNEEHRVSCDNIKKHLSKCCWHQSGYKDDTLTLPKSRGKFATTVVLDKTLQAEIICKAAEQNPSLEIDLQLCELQTPRLPIIWKASSGTFRSTN